ncbi:MAG: hypothetical protein Q9193_006889, partial [Seirophora villosa]
MTRNYGALAQDEDLDEMYGRLMMKKGDDGSVSSERDADVRKVALRDQCYTIMHVTLHMYVNPGFINVLQATCIRFLVGHVIDGWNNDEDD